MTRYEHEVGNSMLSKNQFNVLYTLLEREPLSQRAIAAASGLSLGTVNSTLRGLKKAGFVDSANGITEQGTGMLEPYRVDNAIIMAAGASSRFAPLTFEQPKGLLRVRGEVLVERQIRQLKEAGIPDITVVVGYMKERFFYLEDKFGVHIVVNEEYTSRHNNSTLMLVRARQTTISPKTSVSATFIRRIMRRCIARERPTNTASKQLRETASPA